jgi:ubiquinone biosynthesis protein
VASEAELALERAGYEIYRQGPPGGLISRVLVTLGYMLGLLLGGLLAYVRGQHERRGAWTLGLLALRALLFLPCLFLDRDIIDKPFPVQFRRRLEQLGPTYIKLGQILSLRDDLLPTSITEELKNHLLDQLPAVPLDRLEEILEADLGRSADSMFAEIAMVPLGSASLAQSHRARIHSGEDVVLKVLKPWVRETVQRDTRLLRIAGWVLQPFLQRYQPRRLIDEFASYTLREVDLRYEADNAETFSANFAGQEDVRFPAIYREFSNRDVLCMEYFGGQKPESRYIATMRPRAREKVISLGIGAIIDMIFRDGFFHADLHPGNIIIFEDASVGFIDLGMVGRFGSETRTRMLYYVYALANGDAAEASRYLGSVTIASVGSDHDGFRRAVEDLNRRWLGAPAYRRPSLAQLLLQSVSLAGHYRIVYPGEIVLMAKALVTVEGVGLMLEPDIDIVAASQSHIRRILMRQFDVRGLVRDSVVMLPELLDVVRHSPLVLSEGLRYLEGQMKTQQADPMAGVRGSIFAASMIIAGAIVAGSGGAWWLWSALLGAGFVMALANWIIGRE